MSSILDETAADVPVKDITVTLSRLTAAVQGLLKYHARARQDISRVSREELEDRFLRLNEETMLLKQHINKQDDKIKKLGTKLMRLVKDRGRMEQLAAGGAQPLSRVRDVEMEEMVEELQDKVRRLQTENEGLKQRLLLAKQQLVNSQSHRPTPYGHVQSRVNSGLKRLRDDASSPSQARPKSTRSLEGGGRPLTGQLPRYGHSLLEEARAEIRNLENVIESQRSQMEEQEGISELLREELRKKEAEYEEKLLQVRQQQTSKLRSHVSSNVTMIKLQKQLEDRSNAVAELEGRFLQLQESQQALKASHEAAMAKVDELSAHLKDERLKSLDLEKQLQSSSISRLRMEQLQERIGELEQERDLLKDNNDKLVNSAFDVSQQQKWQIQEQQLRLQISQLETALKADLVDKNEILDKIKAERDTNEKLTEENKKLQIQFLEQKQQLEELNEERLCFCFLSELSHVFFHNVTTSPPQTRKSQKNGDLGFLKEVEEEANSTESSVRELRAAHAETIQELEKTRSLLNVENKISKDYKVEGEHVEQHDKVEYEQKLERQAQLLDTRAAKIRKLEAQLREIAYGTKTYVFKPDVTGEDEAGEFNETLHLERGENLLELQIVSAALSPSALQVLGDTEPSTFCTYSFYLFDLHSTPVVTGRQPRYGFTSRYVVNMDDGFLHYLHRYSVMVELHQALGLDWRTLASGQLRLQQLLEQDGKIHGSIPLVGTSEESRTFGSVDYWLRLRIPMTETIQLFKEKLKAVGYISQPAQLQPSSSSNNELFITVQRCSDLQSRSSQLPSPYVVYKFFDFPDYPTSTVHDRCDPTFNDLKSYAVLMDVDLDQYLQSDVLQFYVFDYKEEQMDTYLGKARVPLLGLAHDQNVTGVFQLVDPTGLPAGHIEVTLKWKSTYRRPPGSIMAPEEPRFIPEEKPVEETSGLNQEKETVEEQKKDSQLKDAKEKLQEENKDLHQSTSQPQAVLSKAPQSNTEKEDDDEEEESHVSEGQLVPVSTQSYSDDSEISEEIAEGQKMLISLTNCVITCGLVPFQPSERLRVEIVSLSLKPDSRVSQDVSVVRLFVEYSILDQPTEETPLSLPKPPPGRSINYNYSKGIALQDVKILKEEEQEKECEDVGVAFLRIPEILEKQRDLMEASLDVLDVEDSRQLIGCLTVSVEGLEALRSIMEDDGSD
uniref:C2 domain-containing protein n=1 Tax=Amphiprion ocellaris TaxID=80972 RepID=A0AAQ5ZA12_AMPOC